MLQEDGLVIGRFRDTAAADVHALAGRQDHVHVADFAELVQKAAGFLAQARLPFSRR